MEQLLPGVLPLGSRLPTLPHTNVGQKGQPPTLRAVQSDKRAGLDRVRCGGGIEGLATESKLWAEGAGRENAGPRAVSRKTREQSPDSRWTVGVQSCSTAA